MVALKCLYCHFVKWLALQNTNPKCFAVINNGVKVLNSNSVVPIKTRCAFQSKLAVHMANGILHFTNV